MSAHLWHIDGKSYDFKAFVKRHPGGKSFINLGKGRDCSELFHSVHCLSDADFQIILDKYEVKDQLTYTSPPIFDWTEHAQFGHELRTQVKQYFKDRHISYKANRRFWMAALMVTLITICCLARWMWTSSVIFGFISGVEIIVLGFFVMHTASHGALSYRPWVNKLFTVLWCNIAYWNHNLWLQHHVYGHHSYTGMYGKDPDVRNFYPFARKHVKQKKSIFSRQQHWLSLLFLLIVPNQYVGQIISYAAAFGRKRLFGMPIRRIITSSFDNLYGLIGVASFLVLFVFPMWFHGWQHVPSCMAYLTACGMTYWAIVFPNHDTVGVYSQTKEMHTTLDWAVLQLAHSSNFYLPSCISQLIGGMNYQIEHHLFPSVHPIHYPEISKIVQRLARKYNLPYLTYKSWFHSLVAHVSFLKELGRLPSQIKYD